MASYPTKDSYGGYEGSRFEKDVDENFHCSICYNVLKEPRTCRNNEHMFCLACISQHLNENSETCPECNENLSVDTLRRPRVVNNSLSKLKINCDYASRGCPEFTCLEELKTHVANCGFSPVLCSNEGCGMEFNRQERVHHETAVCEYRKVKCHDCGQIQVVVGSMMELNEKVDAVREEIKNIPVQDDDEIENHFNEMKQEVEVVKKEVKRVQDNAFKVNEDLAELKVMMSQVLENLNNLEPFTLSAGGYMVPHYTSSRLWNPGPAPKIAIPGQDVLNPSVLAQASAAGQKQMLGERLFPLIQQTHPRLAGKITGMLLEIDNAELLHMLEFHDALAAKVDEAVSVLQAHQERNAKK